MNLKREVTNDEMLLAYNNIDNKNVLRAIAYKYTGKLDDHELTQCSDDALWRCLQYYDPSYGQKFTTSLTRFMYWECNRVLKKKKRKIFFQFLEDSNDVVFNESRSKLSHVWDYVKLLPQEERELIEKYYIGNYTLKEIGVDQKTLDRILTKLKEVLS